MPNNIGSVIMQLVDEQMKDSFLQHLFKTIHVACERSTTLASFHVRVTVRTIVTIGEIMCQAAG